MLPSIYLSNIYLYVIYVTHIRDDSKKIQIRSLQCTVSSYYYDKLIYKITRLWIKATKVLLKNFCKSEIRFGWIGGDKGSENQVMFIIISLCMIG